MSEINTKFVIRFEDGAYNFEGGWPVRKDEASIYSSHQEAKEALDDIGHPEAFIEIFDFVVTRDNTIKFKKLHPAAIIPTRAHSSDAGLDLYSAEDIIIYAQCRETISTGIACQFPENYWGKIEARSGLASKNGLQTLAGILDSAYRGCLKVVLFNSSRLDYTISAGNKIAQLVLHRNEIFEPIEVEELQETERGSRGFGSSDLVKK